RPASTIAAPSDATVVVLATPPFWLATASTRVPFIATPLLRCPSLAVNNCHPGTNSMVPARGWLCVSGRIGQHGRREPSAGVVGPRGNRRGAVRAAHPG